MIFLFRAERNKQKHLAQSLPAEGRLQALDRRRRMQPLEQGEICE